MKYKGCCIVTFVIGSFTYSYFLFIWPQTGYDINLLQCNLDPRDKGRQWDNLASCRPYLAACAKYIMTEVLVLGLPPDLQSGGTARAWSLCRHGLASGVEGSRLSISVPPVAPGDCSGRQQRAALHSCASSSAEKRCKCVASCMLCRDDPQPASSSSLMTELLLDSQEAEASWDGISHNLYYMQKRLWVYSQAVAVYLPC